MLARLAARGEQVRGDSTRRPDGRRPVAARLRPPARRQRPGASRSDEIVDSRRGARGTFTPIPDVQISGITRGEAARLQLAQRAARQPVAADGPAAHRHSADRPRRQRPRANRHRRQHQPARRNQIRLGAVDPRAADAADDHDRPRATSISVQAVAPRRPALAAHSAAPLVPRHSRHSAADRRCRPTGLLQTLNLLRSHARLHRLVAAGRLSRPAAVQPRRHACPMPTASRGCPSASGGGKAAASPSSRSIRSSWPTSRRSSASSNPRSKPSFACTSKTCRNRKSAPGSSASTTSAA